MTNEIFRKEALENVKYSNKIEEVLVVDTPRHWFVLIALLLVFFSALIWGFFGSINEIVKSKGVLTYKDEKITNYIAYDSGNLQKVYVKAGDKVKKGQVIAKISNHEVNTKILNNQDLLNHLYMEKVRYEDYRQEFIKLSTQRNETEKKLLTAKINSYNDLKTHFDKLIKDREKLYDERLVRKTDIIDVKKELYSISNDIEKSKAYIKELELQMNREYQELERKISEIEYNIKQQLAEQKQLKERQKLINYVISNEDGVITEIKVFPGSYVEKNTAIASSAITKNVKALDATLLVPASEGKKIRNQMEVKVIPSTVVYEEYGAILGVVKNVTAITSSKDLLFSVLGNKQLVEDFSKEGPLIIVKVNLKIDEATYSGFQWTTKNGTPYKISHGTLVKGDIITKSQPPITLLFPYIKKLINR